MKLFDIYYKLFAVITLPVVKLTVRCRASVGLLWEADTIPTDSVPTILSGRPSTSLARFSRKQK